jgi:uncharacterized coiled-coil protein SlyX
MEGSLFPVLGPVFKKAAPYIGAVLIGGAGFGYAVHEHHGAQTLAAENQQVTAQLADTNRQLDDTHKQLDTLAAKVNALVASNEANTAASGPSTATATIRKPTAAHRASAQDLRFKKLQSQLDAQGKAIEDARNDLSSTRTELTGSIARTHDELVVLEKKGERNYFEFDLQKSKDFKREGPLSVSLRKANSKRQYADLQLIVDDRTVTQKHVNLYQPAMFYEPESQQPVEVVINDISKDHIHGYISAPKYRPSELAQAPTASADPDGGPVQVSSSAPPSPRKKLPVPSPEPPDQQ